MRLSVLAITLALVVAPISLASASSPSFQQLSRQLSFKPLATGDSSNDQLPAGLPQLDPATLKFIQFPNGIPVILQGYGTASLPSGYPLSSIPSYDSATNTITDPSISYAFAYALSTAANPSYDPSNPDGFLGGSLGGFIPGLTGIFEDGASSAGFDDNGSLGSDDSTGVDDGSLDDGSLDSGSFATGLVIPGASTGTSSLGQKSSTGVAVITNPRISSTGGAGTSGTSPLTGGSVQGSGNTPISNPNNAKNGAAIVASSLAMVTGLVAAVLVATVL